VATSLCKPTLAETSPIILGIATPDAGLLVGLEGILEAVFLNGTG